ncbi:MAG: TonB-dependent siderophore receptor [Gammaproteobacteria bacterium]|nr:TonB-dependent siderophore receptor [Gammaproteobacteria bacterium]
MRSKLVASLLLVSASFPGRADDVPAAPADQVLVIGQGSQVELPPAYAGDQVARGARAGLLGNIDYMDLPFSATAYTQDLVRHQQARSVGDVLQNDPAVRVTKGFGNFQEVYMVRGFPVFSDDMMLNGVYGILPRQFVAAEFIDRVEVFRGANSFLNGAAPGGSGVAGAFNVVPKRAEDTPLTRGTLGFESDGMAYAALDGARRFGAEREFGARLNVVGRGGETAVEDQDRGLTALSLNTDFERERVRIRADLGYQDHFLDSPRPQVTPFGPPPAAPDPDDNFAQPWTFSDEQQLFGALRGEVDLTDHATLWLAFGGRHGEESNRLANPNATANGIGTANRFDNKRDDQVLSTDAGLRVEFNTGPVEHRFISSVSALRSNSKNAFDFYLTPIASDLRAPVVAASPRTGVFSGGVLNEPALTEAVRNWSVALADTMSILDGRVLGTVGVRRQSIATRTFDYNSGSRLSLYDENAVTPVGALVVKPLDWMSLYANYAESLQPGAIAPALVGATPIQNAGEALAPFRGEQVEVGVKVDRRQYGATLAFFSISKQTALVENSLFTDGGEQRHQGIEFSVFGEPLPGVRVLGGVTYVDGEFTRVTGGLNEGNTPIGVPEVQINMNLEWDLPMVPGLTLDGRVVYTDEAYTDAANAFTIPSWTRFDLGARYTTRIAGRAVEVRGRMENLTNRSYWASAGGFPGANYLVLGMPRSFLMSASVDF